LPAKRYPAACRGEFHLVNKNMKTSIIPQNYEEWRHCIIVECGLELSPSFIEQRIAALQNNGEHYTQQFVRKYGAQHHQRVLGWFMQALKVQ